MPRPKSKEELLSASQEKFDTLLALIGSLREKLKIAGGACGEWAIKDILAHLHAWHEMYLIWYTAGMRNEKVPMPAPGFTWKDTPALNEQIYQKNKDRPYADVFADLKASHEKVMAIVASHSDEELFIKKRYGWTGSTSVGSYTVSATSSHYDWAIKEIKKSLKNS